jgi:adenylate cyclase
MSSTAPLLRRSRSVVVPSPRAALWPLLSATDSLNREWGLPAIDYNITPNSRGGSDVQGRATMMGMNLQWEELPFEWIEPSLWRVQRNYSKGPFRIGIYEMSMDDDPGGTKVNFCCEYAPPSVTTHWIVKMAVNSWLEKAVAAAQAASDYLAKRAQTPLPRRYKKAVVNAANLESARRQLRELGANDEMLAKICEDIENLPDEDVVRVRPFETAARWKLPRTDVLVFFMRAVRAGLMDLRWQVICPHCRNARSGLTGLRYLKKQSHCDSCNIDFETEFDKSVEARFTVNKSVRATDDRVFCSGDPSRTPHIRAQLRVLSGATRRLAVDLTPGLYRFRATQSKQMLTVNVGAAKQEPGAPLRLTVNESGFTPAELSTGSGRSDFELTSTASGFMDVKLEHAAWEDNAASGVIVTSLPEFYDLAAKDVLVPDEELAVRSLTMLFSDLRGSTALYRQIGDAAAYALVREHFKVMQEVIRKNHGGIVKTIGDAVMAVFFSAPEALACCFEIQHAFVELWKHKPQMAAMVVKLGFHRGPCIAVNFNNRIDYFGTTVNLAARIQNESHGGDIVFFEELFNDPASQNVLQHYHYSHESFQTPLKGFATEARLVRLVPNWDGMTLPHGTLMMAKHAK